MDEYTRVITLMIRNMDLVLFHGQMEGGMLANGLMENKMAWELTQLKMGR